MAITAATAMAGVGDPLRELVDEEEVEYLLEALRKDLPHSIHVFNRVATHRRWRHQGLLGDDVQVAVYRGTDEGDATEGHTTVVSIMKVEGNATTVAVHTTDPSCTTLRRVLAASKHVPWEDTFIFESVHERCIPDVLAEVRARGDPNPLQRATDKMLLPKDECLGLNVRDPGPGLTLRALEPRHAKVVNDNWPYAASGTENRLSKTMEMNPGLSWGVFTEEDPDGDPVAFVVGSWYGGLALLHTMETHRRLGLGALLTRAASRALAANHGLDAHCNVVLDNSASAATMAKVGFRRVGGGSWIMWKFPAPGSQ